MKKSPKNTFLYKNETNLTCGRVSYLLPFSLLLWLLAYLLLMTTEGWEERKSQRSENCSQMQKMRETFFSCAIWDTRLRLRYCLEREPEKWVGVKKKSLTRNLCISIDRKVSEKILSINGCGNEKMWHQIK